MNALGQALASGIASMSSMTVAVIFVFIFFAALVVTVFSIKNFSQLARRQADLQIKTAEIDQLNESLATIKSSHADLEEQLKNMRAVQTALAASDRENQMVKASSEEVSHQLDNAREELNELKVSYSALQAQTREEKRSLEEKLELLQNSRQQLSSEFELLANKIFDEKTKNFSKNSQQMLDVTLTPLKNQLDDFKKKVDDVYTTEAKERHLLQAQIKRLHEESLRIGEDANNLTRALKADNKAQGNWGELTLIRALEICGLKEPEEYETQVSHDGDGDGESGSRQIPDVIVHLPGGKDIIIDSKVSLVAYSRYFEAETDEQRQVALEQHVSSVRQHVKDLSSKSYQSLPGVTTLDYVMLYIPIEGASAMALQSHKGLWEEAYAKNIVLVSPTNLLAILRSVETIWRHEKQNKNAEEIARQAGNLHDKFVGLIGSLDAVGKNLDTLRKSYDTAYNQLTAGKGNLISRVQNLEKLGAKTKREIPVRLRADDESVSESEKTLEDISEE